MAKNRSIFLEQSLSLFGMDSEIASTSIECNQARLALLRFRNQIESARSVRFKLSGIEREVKILFGKGNSKSIYDIQEDQVIAIPNSDYEYRQLDQKCYKRWCAVVAEESLMAARLKQLGLKVLAYQSSIIEFEGQSILVLTAPSFASLEEKCGMQIIDHRSGRIGHGNSMLFGTVKNLKCKLHLKALFSDLIQDIAVLIVNNLAFQTRDSYNLTIIDSVQTPSKDSLEYAAQQYKLYSERDQKIRLFFYDLTGTTPPTPFSVVDVANSSMSINSKRIAEEAAFCLNEACVTLYTGLTFYEKQLFRSCGAKFSERMVRHNFNLIKAELIEEVRRSVTKELRKFEPVTDETDQNLEPPPKKPKF